MRERFVIRLADGSYWLHAPNNTTGSIDAATKFDSRFIALSEMSRAGRIMHEAAIVPYQRPSDREATGQHPTERETK